MGNKLAVSDEAVASALKEIQEYKGEPKSAARGVAGAKAAAPASLGLKDFKTAYTKRRKYILMAGSMLGMFNSDIAQFFAQLLAFLDSQFAQPAPVVE